jgi:ABC-type multidrug transport system fused ATPase/permease subunit
MSVMVEVEAALKSGETERLSAVALDFKTSLLVDIKDAEVSYGSRVAFKGKNLALAAGRAVAIIGPSGAGKSTIVKSLAGLVKPSKWDASMPWSEVTGHTTLVSQSPFLFKETLRGNLVYGLPDDLKSLTTDEMLWGALRVVNLEDAVKGLTHGLESKFNPLETNLSGGQIQRLVIARAMLRRPSILMLDEATSAVDVATEHDISTRLISTVHETGTILLAVTHRLRWLDLYDQVWFVENGDVTMTGTHRELMKIDRYRTFATTESEA